MKRKVVNKFQGNAKKALLRWVQCTAAKYVHSQIPRSFVLKKCNIKATNNFMHRIPSVYAFCLFSRHHGIEVKDFGPSWRDGVAFQSVVHAIRPDLVNMEVVRRRSNRENLEEAFTLAENELGIPRLLDPEGALDLFLLLPFSTSVMHNNIPAH